MARHLSLLFALLLAAVLLAPPAAAGETAIRVGLQFGASDLPTATFSSAPGAGIEAAVGQTVLATTTASYTVLALGYGVILKTVSSFSAAQAAASSGTLPLGLPGGEGAVLSSPFPTLQGAQGAAQTDGLPVTTVIGPTGVQIPEASLAQAVADAATLIQKGTVTIALPLLTAAGSWVVLAGPTGDLATAQGELAAVQALFPQATVYTPTGSEGLVIDGSGNPAFLVGDLRGTLFEGTGTPAVAGFDGTLYRGALSVLPVPDGNLSVVNTLGIDDYIQGVLPKEMSDSWPAAALEAQAVVSRTYAMAHLGEHASLGFDVTATTSDQVYGGYSAEGPNSVAAVQATLGQILTYDGKPIDAFFFDDSGGATENSENVWETAVPYLRGVSEVPGYQPSTWTRSFTAAAISSLLASEGNPIGPLLDLIPSGAAQTFSGRLLTLTFVGAQGTFTARKDDIRWVMGGLRSTLFTVASDAQATLLGAGGSSVAQPSLLGDVIQSASGTTTITQASGPLALLGSGGATKTLALIPTTYTLSGKGWGHGVGMAQEGAKYMADKGSPWQEIVLHYYTGVTITQTGP